MISGSIRNREAMIEIGVSAPGQPSRFVTALRLPFVGHRRGTLADGSVTRLDVYLATVGWHGQQKDVLISQAAGTPLIGMSLLDGSRMTMDVVEGGDVSIDELP